jgi:hypothetical protein
MGDNSMSGVTAEEIMSDHVISFYGVEKVGKIHNILQRTTHNGFPDYFQIRDTSRTHFAKSTRYFAPFKSISN